jgi:hypothetical protein
VTERITDLDNRKLGRSRGRTRADHPRYREATIRQAVPLVDRLTDEPRSHTQRGLGGNHGLFSLHLVCRGYRQDGQFGRDPRDSTHTDDSLITRQDVVMRRELESNRAHAIR